MQPGRACETKFFVRARDMFQNGIADNAPRAGMSAFGSNYGLRLQLDYFACTSFM